MKAILSVAAVFLTACAGTSGPGTPTSGVLSPPPRGSEADLRARYQQYRKGPPPYLDYETWKRTSANPRDYSGSGS